MASMNLEELDTWDSKGESVNVIIETAKGSRNKFDYEPETQTFALGKVLPRGMAFPFDFGFVPSTLAEDGDPLDVLVLMDEPAFPGCRISCRIIGVIEGANEKDGKTERNDRLVAVASECHEHCGVQSLKDIDSNLLKELEHFFVSYHDLDDTSFKIAGTHGPNRAVKLIKEGRKRFASAPHGEKAASNGRA